MTFDLSSLEEYNRPKGTWGERVKYLRKTLRMTQEDFAMFIGCTYRSVHRWEGNFANPRPYYQQMLLIAEEKFVLPIRLEQQRMELLAKQLQEGKQDVK